MDAITPIIVYFQECYSHSNLLTIVPVLPYYTYASLLRMGIVLNSIQALTAHPIFMIIPYIKVANALFRKLLPLLPFEPILSAGLYHSLMGDLLQSGIVVSSTQFTTKHQYLQDSPYILQTTLEATFSHYFIKTVNVYHKKITINTRQDVNYLLPVTTPQLILHKRNYLLPPPVPAPAPAPGQYVVSGSSDSVLIKEIIIGIMPDKISGEISYKIRDIYGQIYSNTTKILFDPTQGKLQAYHHHNDA